MVSVSRSRVWNCDDDTGSKAQYRSQTFHNDHGAKNAKGGTYSTTPSATLLRIVKTVRMGFDLKQVICDTFHSYVLINPSPTSALSSSPALSSQHAGRGV